MSSQAQQATRYWLTEKGSAAIGCPVPELLDERLDQIRERVRIGSLRDVGDDRDFLMAEVDRLRDQVASLSQRLDAGITQAVAARGGGTSIVMALTGDPGAVVEADPFGRSADA